MPSFQLLLSVLVAVARSALAAEPVNLDPLIDSTINLRTHSLYAPYVDQDLQNRWFSFGADAYVNTNKHVRLTRDRPSETGWLWSRLPITVPNFQIDFEFKISGSSSHIFGDGMAMWLTTRRAEPGPVFGFIDKFEGLGIFIDTFANNQHDYAFPRVYAVLGDGQTAYNNDDDGEPNHLAACSASVRQTDIATKIRVTYMKDRYLDVKVQYRAWDEWTPCFQLENVKLPPSPFLGFTALTGEAHEAHDVISVTTQTLIPVRIAGTIGTKNKGKKGKPEAEASSSGSSFFGFIIKALFVGVILAVAYVGWKAYAAKNGGGDPFGRYGSSGGFATWDSKRF